MLVPRLVVLATVSLLSIEGARAQEGTPLGEPVEAPELYEQVAPDAQAEPQLIAPGPAPMRDPVLTRRDGASIVLSFAGELGAMPRGQVGSGRKVVGGLSGQVVVAPPHVPLLLGLGAGNLWLSTSSQRGPDVTVRDDFERFRSTTTIERSLEIRHFEAVVRLQPYFGRVRPYLEGSFGLGVLWQGADLEDDAGNVLARQDRQRKATWISGGAAGLDIALHQPDGDGGFCLSLGVKGLRTGALPRIVFSDAQEAFRVSSSGRAKLTMWLPFVAVSYAY